MATRQISQMEPWFGTEEAESCYEYMKSGYFITEFHKTKEFEQMLCDYTGAKHCIVTNNGTTTLYMIMLALGISQGDEVIVPNYTMIASPNSVMASGAKPVYCDIYEDSLTMDFEQMKTKITPKTKAIMFVPLNNRSKDLDKFIDFCKANNLYLIMDTAQSIGSFKNGKHLSNYGDISSISFSPPKLISTGQGGAILTNSDELALKLRKIKDFGRERGGVDLHDSFGLNFKFTDLQACVGIEQMKKLEWRVQRQKEIWKLYYERLSKHPKIKMLEGDDVNWITWFIDIYVENPDELQKFLKDNNIGSRRVYPPCNSQKIYAEHNKLDFPVTKYWTDRGLWLPSSVKLTDDEVNFVCDKIFEFYKSI